MIYAIIVAGTLAFIFALLLSLALKRFAKEDDPLVKEIYEALPKNNCGGCGYVNCEQYAKAVSKDHRKIGKCVVGGDHTAKKLGEILHEKIKKSEKIIAQVHCCGGKNCEDKSDYQGVLSCSSASSLGGYKSCEIGCLGLGDCVSVCKFDAIKINDQGFAEVDFNKCVGCGACVKACPNRLITLREKENLVRIACSSHKKDRPKFCKTSCIGCGICAKNCPEGAITMDNNLPVIDYNKCTNCMICVEKCPRKVIKKI